MASISSATYELAKCLVDLLPNVSPLPGYKVLFAESVSDLHLSNQADNDADGQRPPQPAEIVFVQLPNGKNVIMAHLTTDPGDIRQVMILDGDTAVITSEPHLSMRWCVGNLWNQVELETQEQYWKFLACFGYHNATARGCDQAMAEQIATLQAEFLGVLESKIIDDLSPGKRVEFWIGNQVLFSLVVIAFAIALASCGLP